MAQIVFAKYDGASREEVGYIDKPPQKKKNWLDLASTGTV